MTLTTEAAPQDPAPRSRSRGRGRALLLLAAVVLAGAGAFAAQRVLATEPHDHSSHSHAPDVDPCTLLPIQEVATVLGPVGEPFEGGTGVVTDQVVCVVPLQREPRYGATVGYANFGVGPKYLGFARGFPGVTEAIEGVGDEAVWVKIFRVVVVRSGDKLVSVQMTDVFEDEAIAKDKATAVARIALDRVESR